MERTQQRYKTEVDGMLAPDRNEEYLLYQTLIGAWPFHAMDEDECKSFSDRIQAYMAKALKEAKIHTSWVNPNHAYDQAVRDFIERILVRASSNPFLADFLPFQREIARHGVYNSLSQVLLKLLPGFGFLPGHGRGIQPVDPYNRRPVDYPHASRFLAASSHRGIQ